MPHIDNDVKLDFKDVLLRPKRSTLKSRVEVDLNRSFKFRNSKASFNGVPIIAANMDTVGTFEMAEVMAKVCAPTRPSTRSPLLSPAPLVCCENLYFE